MASDLFQASTFVRPKIRVCLLIDSPHLQAVFAKMLKDIQASDFAEVVLVVVNGAYVAPRATSPAAKLVKFLRRPTLRNSLLYSLYYKFDVWRCHDPERDPFRIVDCGPRLADIPHLVAQPGTGAVHRFSAAELDAVRAARPDVLVRFGFNILKGDILQAAPAGIWSFHHGDNTAYRGSPPYLWELIEGNDHCGAVLQILNERLDDGLVIAKGRYACEGGLSLFRNRVGPYWASSYFLIWKLRELYEDGLDAVKARAVPSAPYVGRKAVYRKPGNREMLRWILRSVSAKLVEKSRRRILHWQVALRSGAFLPAIRPGANVADLDGFQFLPAPKGHAYADPFLFAHEGRTFLFMEDYDYAARRGDIVVSDITSGTAEPARLCLSTGSHLSYPQVFAHEGEIYMIPESAEAGEVALYRAARFPDEWVKAAVLFEGPAVDTTLFVHEGVWYVFTSLLVPGTEAASLHLFTTDGPAGPWRLHPSSPISNDVRDVRGAGRIFAQDGVLYRPSQDRGATYGSAIRIHRIDVLSPDAYAETLVMHVGADAVPPVAGCPAEGIHTYDEIEGFAVIDAKFALPAREVLA